MLAGAFVLHGQIKHPSSHLIQRPSDALIAKFDERANNISIAPTTNFVIHVVKLWNVVMPFFFVCTKCGSSLSLQEA
jgi:hypothetical protein